MSGEPTPNRRVVELAKSSYQPSKAELEETIDLGDLTPERSLRRYFNLWTCAVRLAAWEEITDRFGMEAREGFEPSCIPFRGGDLASQSPGHRSVRPAGNPAGRLLLRMGYSLRLRDRLTLRIYPLARPN